MLLSSTRLGPRYFTAPSAGRRILAGFSYLQRIGKGATTRVWFPEQLDGETVEWAAIRQFEILQEAGNLAIDALDVTELNRSFQAWSKMRAGGYRVTIVTLGCYVDTPETDDLYVLDQKIQEEITRLIHFLYLSEQSETESTVCHEILAKKEWCFEDALPHVAMALGAKRLFKPHKQDLAEQTFFEILKRLPQNQILHDVAVGLVLPDASKEKNWIYIAKDEHTPASFFGALGTTVGVMVRQQMRGHGDRMKTHHTHWQQEMARAAA